MNENQISGEIIDACIKIHKALGPGLLETVYETVLAYELRARGYIVASGIYSCPLRRDNA